MKMPCWFVMLNNKRAEGVNWYLIGAIIFAVLIIVIVMIAKGQAGGQEGLLSWIFSSRP